jgi:putative ABC transport system permease protein
MTAKTMTLPWGEWWLLPSLLLGSVVVGVAAGLYPAFYLSDFKPIKVLKGQVTRGSRNSALRGVLVVFQFTTSIILIIGTFVIYRQVQYILHKKVGFDKDQVLLIQGTNTLSDADVRSFRNELAGLSQVKSVSISDYLPVSGTKRNGNGFYNFNKPNENPTFAQFWIGDYDYIPTMGMHLLAGRNFSRDMASDSTAVIINQTLAKKLGLGDHPVGQRIMHYGTPVHVVGLVEDFNFESFRDTVDGLCLGLGLSSGIVSVKMRTADVGDLIPQVSAVWKKFAPDQPIRYTFMDESFKNMYADISRDGTIFTSFAVLAVIIACLGLFALSAFMAEQRTKEMGIRKVLGASVADLMALMSRDFVVLVVIAILIASPIAWWGMHKWLEDFVYRQEISWWLFPIVGLTVIGIALVTIGFQSIRTALENPIKSLRSE